MRATLIAFLASCQVLISALPSGLDGNEDLVPARHGVVERQPVGSSWTEPSCMNTIENPFSRTILIVYQIVPKPLKLVALLLSTVLWLASTYLSER